MPSAWGLPPEINYTLLRSGAGAAAHAPQVAAYTALATHYTAQSAQQTMVAAATAPNFVGIGGAAMLAQALPMAAWQSVAAMHASTTAATLSSGIAAYQTAFASMIPDARCIANRVETATLHATNFMGFNTPAIIEHDVEYAEYWAQNASARTGLAATLTGLSGQLAVPLPAYPGMSNPGASAAVAGAGIGSAIGSTGFGVASSAMSAGSGAANGAATALGAGLSTGLSTGLGAASGLAADTPLTGAASPTPSPAPASAPAMVNAPATIPPVTAPFMPATAIAASTPAAANTSAGPAPELAPPAMQAGLAAQSESGMSGMVGELASSFAQAPEALMTAAAAPLQGATQLAGLPMTMLAAAPLSALAGGMSRNPEFSMSSKGSAASSARSPLTGMSAVNGGWSGGGSPVDASVHEAPSSAPTSWATPPAEASTGPEVTGTQSPEPAPNGIGMMPPPLTSAGRDDRTAPSFDPSYKTVIPPTWEGAVLN